VLLLAVVFADRLRGDFVWDDVPLVANNPTLVDPGGWWLVLTRDLWGSAGQPPTQLYHPLPMLTLWLQVQVHGLQMVWLRAGNVALHAGCALLLLAILRRRRVPERSAWLSCALFVVHPLVTEPVMWLTGRHDTLAAAFALLALLAFPERDEPRAGLRLSLSGACSAAAFASKEPYVIVPVLVAFWSLLDRPLSPLRRLAPRWLAPVAGVLAVLTVRSALHIPTTSVQVGAAPLVHLQNYAGILQHYGVLALTLEQGPTIASFRPPSVATAAGVLVVSSLAIGGLLSLRGSAKGRLALFGCAWFLLALLPHIVSLPVIGLWGNRYGYFPLLGLGVALASALWVVEAQPNLMLRRAAAAVVALCVLLGAAQTRLAAANFHDDLALYEASVLAAPDDGRALYHYAYAVRERAGCSGAIGFLLRATQLDPGYARAQRNLAGCLLDLGQPVRAVEPAERAVALEPEVASHRYNLGAALIGAGQRQRGVAQLKRALALDPGHAAARRLLNGLGEQ